MSCSAGEGQGHEDVIAVAAFVSFKHELLLSLTSNPARVWSKVKRAADTKAGHM